MKVYLDDVRTPPDGWFLTRTAPETVEVLENNKVTHLSLDHDLGEEPGVGNGNDVLIWIEEQVALNGYHPPVIDIHSSNPAARLKMNAAVASINRLARNNLSGKKNTKHRRRY